MPTSLTPRRAIAVLSATALLGGAGLGAAQAAQSDGAAERRAGTEQRRGPLPASALAKIADALGVSTAELRAAMQATRPGKPASGQRPERGARAAELAAALAQALGAETDAVREILEAHRPAGPAADRRPARGARPTAPDLDELVAALATGLDVSEAKVRAALDELHDAHRAEREQRHTAMYAALAQELGLRTEQVRAAFEANRPQRPAR